MSEVFARAKDLPSTHMLGAGTAMCAGCGGLSAVKEMYDVLGKNTVFVNAAGCMTMLSVYPFTPFRGSWLYTSMASAPAGGQGIRDALDILMEKKRMTADEDLQRQHRTGEERGQTDDRQRIVADAHHLPADQPEVPGRQEAMLHTSGGEYRQAAGGSQEGQYHMTN